MISERHFCVSSWNPPFVLDDAPFPSNPLIRNFDHERVGYVANSVEQVLLPRDMAKLQNLKKHEMFLSLKRDLALVHFLSSSITITISIARATIYELNKELEQKTKDMGKIQQVAFDLGQKETEAHFKSQIPVVCRSFCLRT